jgi:hypothetical protein
MSRTRDEISWQVERWAWEGPAAHWEPSAFMHYDAAEATREAEQSLARYGGRWRVVRITKALIRVWP